jgi:hypothetical protein
MTEAVHDHAHMSLYRVKDIDGWWQLRLRSESLFKAVRRIGEENEIPRRMMEDDNVVEGVESSSVEVVEQYARL